MHTKYKTFINELKVALAKPLPGSYAHELVMPEHRKGMLQSPYEMSAQLSSVAILFFPGNNGVPNIVFIKRVEYKGVHSGQISFPGGKSEKSDKDLYETAYRELFEEIGVERQSCETLGLLTELFVPPSNFIINPVVTAMQEVPILKMDPREVAEILTVPFDFFMESNAVSMNEVITSDMMSLKVPGYLVNNHIIWGATAMILSELLQVVKNISRYGDV